MINSQLSIAILIPCYNEEAGIADVINAFKKHIPTAIIYVYDNNSTDQTITRAQNVGAVVRSESRQGKGNVVRRMFADIEADLYIMIDGDGTYDASAAPALVQQLLDNNLDMVIGTRKEESETAHRAGQSIGNLTALCRPCPAKASVECGKMEGP